MTEAARTGPLRIVIICGRCGRENPDQVSFCLDCGNAVTRNPATSDRAAAPNAEPASRWRPPAPSFDLAREGEADRAAHDKISCPGCGASNRSLNRFCAECGRELRVPGLLARSNVSTSSEQTCSNCYAVNPSGVRFCHSCGTKLGGGAQPTNFGADKSISSLSVPTAPNPGGGSVRARLILIRQDGSPGRSYDVLGQQVDIGSSEGDIQLSNDPYVSPRHARLFWRNGKFVVRDLDSVNGVYLRVLRPHPLSDGDLILIGLEVLRFELVRGIEAGLGTAMERGTQLFGSPATPRYARLCQMTVEGVPRDVFYLGRNETAIGRETGDIVFTSDPFMSRRHALISRAADGRGFTLHDLGSSNGTYVAIRAEAEINHGDHIRIGQHLFRLEVEQRPVS